MSTLIDFYEDWERKTYEWREQVEEFRGWASRFIFRPSIYEPISGFIARELKEIGSDLQYIQESKGKDTGSEWKDTIPNWVNRIRQPYVGAPEGGAGNSGCKDIPSKNGLGYGSSQESGDEWAERVISFIRDVKGSPSREATL